MAIAVSSRSLGRQTVDSMAERVGLCHPPSGDGGYRICANEYSDFLISSENELALFLAAHRVYPGRGQTSLKQSAYFATFFTTDTRSVGSPDVPNHFPKITPKTPSRSGSQILAPAPSALG